MIASLSREEIMRRALSSTPISKEELLEIYADGANWVQDYDGPDHSCRWIWRGPTICPMDVALWGLHYGEKK